jgi:toxin CcdB
MTQFDVFANPESQTRTHFPLLVCLQSDLVASQLTQIAAPLVLATKFTRAATPVTPAIQIDEQQYIALVPRMVVLPARLLKDRIANLSGHRDDLLGAVDLLFYGV